MKRMVLLLAYMANRRDVVSFDQQAQKWRVDHSAWRDAETIVDELLERTRRGKKP